MIRNEYRRAFIMLRAVMPGYGGHIRLERRTLTGSMYFIITAPQGVSELSAALIGQREGVYYAAPIGPLGRDRRGQLTLAWQFDPRSIEGRPLEAYPWVAVVATGGPCALALTGNVEGSRTMDSQALERAACTLFAPPRIPAADLPQRESEPGAPEPEAPAVPPTASDAQTQGDVRVYTPTRARLRRESKPDDQARTPQPAQAEARPSAPRTDGVQPQDAAPQTTESQCQPATPRPDGVQPQDTAPQTTESQCQPATPRADGEQPSAPPPTDAQPPSRTPETDDAGPAAPSATPQTCDAGPQSAMPRGAQAQPSGITAAKQLGLDITAPWPDVVEPLRRRFATQPPADDAPADGYCYVRMPMPEASGYPESLAGLKVENGQIAAVRYALPGRRAPEPPAGLEAWRWLPTLGEAGFWVVDEAV